MLDRLPPSELLDYHNYRKRLKHMYICQKCAHGFDTFTPVEECIFCKGPVKEVERGDKATPNVLYTYVCSSCHKNFITEKAEFCIRCGSKYLHSYKTGRITTGQILSHRKELFKQRIKKLFKK